MIEYIEKKSLFQSIQDFACFTFENYIFYIMGFCVGLDKNYKNYVNESIYKRGFFNSIWRYDINNDIWDYIGNINNFKPRQCVNYISFKNKAYIFGGYSYEALNEEELEYYEKNKIPLPPKKGQITYNDLIELEFDIESKILYFKRKINLPFKICSSAICLANNKLYLHGGSIYTCNGFDIKYNNIGSQFIYFDVLNDNIDFDNIHYLNNFNGTARYNHSLIYYNDNLYLFGGVSNSDSQNIFKGYYENTELNVMDNWIYNIKSNKWNILKKLPFCISNFTPLIIQNKIYFFGGCRYNNSIFCNKSYKSDKNKFVKNTLINDITTIEISKFEDINSRRHFNGYYSNLVFYYNLEVDNFNFYDYLPINCSMPKIISTKGKIFLSPNEVNLGLFNNKFYGRHSTLFLELMIN
jgi:hypothetical protein